MTERKPTLEPNITVEWRPSSDAPAAWQRLWTLLRHRLSETDKTAQEA